MNGNNGHTRSTTQRGLEAEWRAIILSKLDSLETDIKELTRKIGRFDPTVLQDHERRIRSLELVWAKAVGALFIVQAIMGTIIAFMVRFFT